MKLFGLKDKDGNEVTLELESTRGNDTTAPLYQIKGVKSITPEPKFKVGDWVYKEYGITKYYRIKRLIGTLYAESDDGYVHTLSNCRLATKEKIETHLKRIANEKGFAKGVKFRKTWDADDIYGTCGNKLKYSPLDDTLTYADAYPGDIYQQGKWAGIIPEKKKLPKTKEGLSKLICDYERFKSNKMNEGWSNYTFLDQYED